MIYYMFYIKLKNLLLRLYILRAVYFSLVSLDCKEEVFIDILDIFHLLVEH